MMHFIAKIEDFNSFEKKRFSQTFRAKFISNIKQRNKLSKTIRTKLPDFHLFYSLESKIVNDAKYDHIHLMIIFDTNHNRYGSRELQIAVTKSLSSMPGIEKLSFDEDRAIFFQSCGRELPTGFLKLRNRKSTIKIGIFRQLYWHDLKTELPDAVCRASYLCKLDQKALLPEEIKQASFSHTRFKSPKDKQFLEKMREQAIGKGNVDITTAKAVNDDIDDELENLIVSLNKELTEEEVKAQIKKNEEELFAALNNLLLDVA